MSDPDPAQYQQFRNQALEGSRKTLGLPAGTNATQPWAVVMDTSFEEGGSYTVVAIADGNASIYFSSGGGFIGGIQREAVRNAAQATVAVAEQFQPKMSLAKTYPLPKGGYTTFYLLTDSGTYTASALEDELGEKRHSLWPLFYAVQEVVTQYRLIDEQRQ